MEIDGDRLNSTPPPLLSFSSSLSLSLSGLPMETDGAGLMASAPAD